MQSVVSVELLQWYSEVTPLHSEVPLWSVQSSGDFIDRHLAMLVFYARVKSRAEMLKHSSEVGVARRRSMKSPESERSNTVMQKLCTWL